APISIEFTQTRTQHNRSCQSTPATDCVNHAAAGEVYVPLTQSEVRPKLREPATTPGPVAINGIDQGRNKQRIDTEGGPFPALGHSTGRDGGGGIHENHLEQEHHRDPNVVGPIRQEETFIANQPPGMTIDRNRKLVGQGTQAAQVAHAYTANAAELESK